MEKQWIWIYELGKSCAWEWAIRLLLSQWADIAQRRKIRNVQYHLRNRRLPEDPVGLASDPPGSDWYKRHHVVSRNAVDYIYVQFPLSPLSLALAPRYLWPWFGTCSEILRTWSTHFSLDSLFIKSLRLSYSFPMYDVINSANSAGQFLSLKTDYEILCVIYTHIRML